MISAVLAGLWATARAWWDEQVAPMRARRAARLGQRRRGRLLAVSSVRRAR